MDKCTDRQLDVDCLIDKGRRWICLNMNSYMNRCIDRQLDKWKLYEVNDRGGQA